ncbi:MAG: phosphoribosyl-AMP cyclohydrolase [Elusimicrobiota bacterium]
MNRKEVNSLVNSVKFKFDSNGLIPAIVQDYKDGTVLMLAYMNLESIKRTLENGLTCFWSRSRKEYWVKGLTSGHLQKVKKVLYDCDADALVIKVRQVGGIACHTGKRSCFFRELKGGSTISMRCSKKSV